MNRRGPKPGRRQQQTSAFIPHAGMPLSSTAYFPPTVAGKLAAAVPSMRYEPSGRTHPVSVKLGPEPGTKAWLVAQAIDMSVSGLLVELVSRMPVNLHGGPLWLPGPAPAVNGLLCELVSRMVVDGEYRPDWSTPVGVAADQLALVLPSAFAGTAVSAA